MTEFLPVSSSGHLAIGKELLGVEATQDLAFEITVHAATVLATIVVFWKSVVGYVKGFFRFRKSKEMDFVLKIFVSMIPVFIVGVFFKDQVEMLFSSLYVVGGALILTSVLLYFSDAIARSKVKRKNNCTNGISYWQAFVVGLGQAVAVIPGLSRSGTTISTGLLVGVKREVVAQFSFLMVIIPILGEAFLSIVGGDLAASTVGVLPLAVGFLSAFISGIFACRVMIDLVKKAQLKWFALYCLVVGVAIVAVKVIL